MHSFYLISLTFVLYTFSILKQITQHHRIKSSLLIKHLLHHQNFSKLFKIIIFQIQF